MELPHIVPLTCFERLTITCGLFIVLHPTSATTSQLTPTYVYDRYRYCCTQEHCMELSTTFHSYACSIIHEIFQDHCSRPLACTTQQLTPNLCLCS